jgi:hypothetical protein
MITINNKKFIERLKELLNRKFEQSTTGVDIPRLMKNISLKTNKETNTFMTNQNCEKGKEILRLLNIINKYIEEKEIQTTENFEDVDSLKEYLKTQDDSKFNKILKSISQSVIILPVTFIKLQIPKILFKDSKIDGWKIEINMNECSVKHIRKEQVFDGKNLKILFDFNWEFKVFLNKETYDFEYCTCIVNISEEGLKEFATESEEIKKSFNNMGVESEIESAKVLSLPKNFYKISFEKFKKLEEEKQKTQKMNYFMIAIIFAFVCILIKKYLF